MSIKISQESDSEDPAMTLDELEQFIKRAKALNIGLTFTKPTVMIDADKHIWKIAAGA